MAWVSLMSECAGKTGEKTVEPMSWVVKVVQLKLECSSKAAGALAGRAANIASAAVQLDTAAGNLSRSSAGQCCDSTLTACGWLPDHSCSPNAPQLPFTDMTQILSMRHLSLPPPIKIWQMPVQRAKLAAHLVVLPTQLLRGPAPVWRHAGDAHEADVLMESGGALSFQGFGPWHCSRPLSCIRLLRMLLLPPNACCTCFNSKSAAWALHGMARHGMEWHGIAHGTMCGQSGVWAMVLVHSSVWKHNGLRSMHVDSIVRLQ